MLTLPGVRPAFAHALLERASPGPEALLRSAPSTVRLTFSEDLNAAASKIIVWDRFRHVENIGPARLVPGQTRELEVGLNPLHPGAYLVLWTSVSADDGHVLHGAYLFYVKVRGPGPSLAGVSLGGGAQTFPDGPGLGSIVSHWIELLTAVSWVGAETFFLFVLMGVLPRLDYATREREARRRSRLIGSALILLLLSSSAVILLLAYGLAGSWSAVFTQSTWSEVFADQYGKLWLWRQGIVLLALAMMLRFHRRPALSPSLAAAATIPHWRRLVTFEVVLGAIYLYLLAASGHAASANIGEIAGSRLFTGAVFADWLHFIADSLWLGGQVYIGIVLIEALHLGKPEAPIAAFLDALRRFSPVAYASIAIFTVSGVFNAIIHVPSFYAFFNSVYGKTLIIKIVLVGIMMAVSALTVYIIRPRIRRALRADGGEMSEKTLAMTEGLRFWLRVNPVLGAGVLLATSVLFSYPVPFGFVPPGPSSYTAHAGGVTAVITIKPDKSGPNQLRVAVEDRHHRPLAQAHVTVLTTMLDMVMGTQVAPLQETQPGVFSGPAEFGMGGHWRLLVLLYLPSGQLDRLPVDVRVGL